MKTFRILLLGIILLCCQTVFAQAVNSSVKIKIDAGNYVVSGAVSSQPIKDAVIGKIKSQLGANADFSRLNVQPETREFEIGWFTELDAALQKIKSWKSGVFIFSNQPKAQSGVLSREITGASFLLMDGRRISLEDYKNKVVVLFFNEAWNVAGVSQVKELNKFYSQFARRNLEIIGLSVETAPDEKERLRRIYKKFGVKYRFGWSDEKLFNDFVKISKVNGIPLTFVIFNGRYYGLFLGSSPKTMDSLKQTIIKTLDENNL